MGHASFLQTILPRLDMFRRGLGEVGFAEGRNVAIQYRWAEGQYDRLPAMAVELVDRPVHLIIAQSPPAALAAKWRTSLVGYIFSGVHFGSKPAVTLLDLDVCLTLLLPGSRSAPFHHGRR